MLFLASGAAGLIYQVVWTQDLVLIFGDTTLAIVTTVSAFLAGLGIGSLIGAAVGARLRRALAVYGLLEIAVGCLALLMPLAFDGIATVFRSAYLSFPPTEVELIRFGLAFLALAPPTILMGMSLPLLTRHLVRNDPDVGERIARLYGLNTLGAVAGSLASGYLLIELIGLRATTLVAVGLNLCAGGGALLMFRAFRSASDREPSLGAGLAAGAAAGPTAGPRPPLLGRQWLLLVVTFTSGLVSLALEVLWTRMALQGTGSAIYVFIAVVAVFLIGVAGGSLIYERRRAASPQLATLGALLAVAAALALVPMIVGNRYGPNWLPLAVGLILPVTTIFGYTFPLTVRLFAGTADQASRGVGFVYAANTAGCVAGTVLAGFVLIPTIGVSASIIVVGLVLAALGGALALGSVPRLKLLRPAASLAAVAALLAVFFTPGARLTYVQRSLARAGVVKTAHFEDSVASVDVVGGKPRDRKLLINGVGITNLTIVTKLLAYVPKAARPNATTMLNICFGMGSTFRSSIVLGLHTTAVDLDPTVPSVMPWFYSDANNYLHNPLSQVVISDGRNYVRLSDKRYDLITVDPPPPVWSAGAVVLQDQEFYQEAAQRLTPGGVLTSYIPLQQPQLEKMLLRTFRTAFRYMSVVYAPGHYGVYIMGSQAPITFTPAGIRAAVGTPTARADLRGAPDYKPTTTAQWVSEIQGDVWLTNNQVDAYAGPGPLITDDHPLTEYFLLLGRGAGPTQLVQQQCLLVTGLLALLIVAYAVDSALRRRPRAGAGSPAPLSRGRLSRGRLSRGHRRGGRPWSRSTISMDMNDDLCFTPAVELARRLHSRELSARELLDAFLSRIHRINPQLNAIVTLAEEQAAAGAAAADEAAARGDRLGVLHGLPIAVKDLADTAGIRTTYGSPLFAGHVPDADAPHVALLRAAGAVIVGKTNTPEFGAGSQTFNAVFGATRNPWDTRMTPGGSSGGAAAAVAAGLLPFADGSDLAASIRNPAAMCSLVGLRTTPGTIPSGGDFFNPLPVLGPVARSAPDAALLLAGLRGHDPGFPLARPGGHAAATAPGTWTRRAADGVAGLRIAWSPDLGGLPVEPEVARAHARARDTLAAAGAVITAAEPDLARADEAFLILRAVMMAGRYGPLLETARDQLKDTLIWNIEQGLALSGPRVAAAQRQHSELFARMKAFLRDYDVLAAPTVQVAPFPVEQEWVTAINGIPQDTYIDWLRSCSRITMTAHPAVSVPAGFTTDGLPVGLQLVGRYGTDDLLLSIADAVTGVLHPEPADLVPPGFRGR